MDFSAPAHTAINAIFAAIIAGAISFIVTVLAKDQKISEFRQAWIDGLRNDIAEQISLMTTIVSSLRALFERNKNIDEIHDYLFEKEDNFCKLELVEARIRLRINPSEHTKFLDALTKIHEHLKSKEGLGSRELWSDLNDQFIAESQNLLKKEWKRVKRGEPVFFATKWISLVMFIIATIFGVLYALGHLHIVFV